MNKRMKAVSEGITGEPNSFIWNGIQSASLKALSKVQNLVNTGAKITKTFPRFGTPLQAHCNLIIAARNTHTVAVASSAQNRPKILLVVVGAAIRTSVDTHPVVLPDRLPEIIIDAGDR